MSAFRGWPLLAPLVLVVGMFALGLLRRGAEDGGMAGEKGGGVPGGEVVLAGGGVLVGHDWIEPNESGPVARERGERLKAALPRRALSRCSLPNCRNCAVFAVWRAAF